MHEKHRNGLFPCCKLPAISNPLPGARAMRLTSRWTLAIFILHAFLTSSVAQDKKEDKSQEKSDRLTAMDVFNLQYAGDPQISPDGKRTVYARQFSDVMNDKPESN